VNPIEKHLSPDEIEWLLEGRLPEGRITPPSDERQVAAEHVAGCGPCRKLLTAHELAREEVRRSKAANDVHVGESCPSEHEWWELAAGLASESRAAELVELAIHCEACALLLRDASEMLSANTTEAESREIESLESATEAWQRAVAARLRGANRQATPTARPARRRAAFLLAAAAIAALAFFGLLLVQTRTSSVDRLLAEAYSERRPVELRIAGASHAPVRQHRSGAGSALSKPAALLRSEYLIKENLETRPDDPFWLAAKGRAEILDWNYEEAIRSLSHALEATPESPELLRDLATAYFQRAEAEGRPTDYGQAVELLGRALAAQPNDPVSLFNRAIASERLFAFEQAIADWERYLQLDPEGDWAREANDRLQAVRRRLDRSSAPEILEDPEAAIRELEGGLPALDDYLDVALTRWLPRLQQPSERRALSVLAEALVNRHGDTWLRDVLSLPLSPRLQEGLAAIADAARLRGEGRFDAALDRANDASASLSQEGCAACVLRARWETAYALQRAQRGRDCLDEARSAFDSTPKDYLWLRTQLILETTACSLMVGELDAARHAAAEALRVARTADYELLLLRSLYFAGVAVGRDDPPLAWSYFFEGLERHWSGTYRPFMVYQFYAEMAYTPEREGEWHLSTTLSREAVTHMSRTPNRLLEAMARHSLGVAAHLAGDPVLAEKELARAARFFDALPPSVVNRTFRFSAEVYRASLESQDGRPDVALERLLSAAPPNPRDVSQYWIWLHFYRTLGHAFLRDDRVEDAERAVRAALSISEMALSSLSDDRDRTLWERQSGQVYRTLVELELAKGESDRALEVMEWYRAAPLRETGSRDVASELDFSTLASTATLPPMHLVRDTVPTLSDASVVSYARLSSGLFAWVFDDRGIRAERLAPSSEDIDRLARRFHRLCSDPTSDIEEVRELGADLSVFIT
jgi:tetratricopeptide (TPR) repeat protein